MPADQSLPAACPACGLVLEKYAQRQIKARETAARLVRGESIEKDSDEDTIEEAVGWRAVLFPEPDPTTVAFFWMRAALFIFFAIWGYRLIAMDYRDGEMGNSFLPGPLLIFHEAGHVIFRLFGEFMTILGGTLGQLIMPAIICGTLLIKNRDAFGASIGLWLIGTSLLDVAPYVYDALEPQLMLLSGTTGEEGGHDWIYLLTTMGLLKKAHILGSMIHKLGAIVIILSLIWGAFALWKQYSSTNKNESP
jgi:heme A synthase